MNAKYLVRQVVTHGDGTGDVVIATALIFSDPRRGLILTREWGGLDLVEANDRGPDGSRLYNVLKAKVTRQGRVIARRVGEFRVGTDGVTARLCLDLRDAPLVAYRTEPSSRSSRPARHGGAISIAR